MIPNEHPSWNVIDSTKLKAYIECPRKYFYEYVIGWAPDTPAHALWFGSAVHTALEYMLRHKPRHGYDPDISVPYELFLKAYREKFPADTDDTYYPKNPDNVVRMLEQYVNTYVVDSFKVEEVEISGSVSIGEKREIFFRLDAIIGEEGVRNILEHKTSAWSIPLWTNSMHMSIQAGTGLHVLKSMYGKDSPYIHFNGLFFRKSSPPKKDGTPRANAAKGNELFRLPVAKSAMQMQDWLVHARFYYDSIQEDMNILSEEKVDAPVMESFPKRNAGCFAYNRTCPFFDFCTTWTNPLRSCKVVQPGFVQKYWDPRDLDTEYTKKVEL